MARASILKKAAAPAAGKEGGIVPVSSVAGRTVVMVDAGYLYATSATWLAQNGRMPPARGDIELECEAAIDRLRSQAMGMFPAKELFRICWYDASPHGNIAMPDHIRLAQTDLVKMRMGRLTPDKRQKGVDVLLALDMARMAREKAVTDILLLSGDEDLLEAVREAQQHSARVHLIGLANAEGTQSVSTRMKQECDTFRELSAQGLVRLMGEESRIEAHAPQTEIIRSGGASAPAVPAPQPAPVRPTGGYSREEAAELVRKLKEKQRVSEQAAFASFERMGGALLPEMDGSPVIVSNVLEARAQRAIEQLMRELSQQDLYDVRSTMPPSVPPKVDGQLLRCVSRALDNAYLSESDKRWVREVFRRITG